MPLLGCATSVIIMFSSQGLESHEPNKGQGKLCVELLFINYPLRQSMIRTIFIT